MFTIYQQIANRLQSKVTGLRTIDFDNGQLADPEKAYPLDYPAVLIDLEDIVWNDEAQKIQSGKATLSITVAVLPVNQSHQNSPTINEYVRQMAVINDVYTALKGYSGGDIPPVPEPVEGDPVGEPVEPVSFSPLTRTRTQRQKRYDKIQAFTHTFTTSFKDRTAQSIYTKPVQPPELDLKH
jgi:hypothetical protein